MRPLFGLILGCLSLCLGGCGLPAGVTVASYAADGGLYWVTDKSSNDHLLSLMAGQDCATWRLIKGRQICADYKPGEGNPYDVDYMAPHREVGEGGMVTVYSSARQGGRMLSGEDAAVAMRAAPGAAARRKTELADAAAAEGALAPEPTVAGPARKAVVPAKADRARSRAAVAGRRPMTVSASARSD
ncbi:MAG TPA: hypothetical protein VJ890_05510 [Vineibacter sp.]|nr:hypothetical protein [Vineibacter sp.]